MKMRLLPALAALAIGFALPAFAEEQNTVGFTLVTRTIRLCRRLSFWLDLSTSAKTHFALGEESKKPEVTVFEKFWASGYGPKSRNLNNLLSARPRILSWDKKIRRC